MIYVSDHSLIWFDWGDDVKMCSYITLNAEWIVQLLAEMEDDPSDAVAAAASPTAPITTEWFSVEQNNNWMFWWCFIIAKSNNI